MHKTRIDLPMKVRTRVIELLNGRLADGVDLYGAIALSVIPTQIIVRG